MIARLYCLASSFLIGVSLSGIISYSAYTFPSLRKWAFSVLLIYTAALMISCILDEQAANWLGLPYRAYLAVIISLTCCLLIGGIIQWQ